MNLNEILKKHEMWLEGKEGGECADLRGTDLRGTDLEGTDLRNADLRGTDLRNADLEGTDLRGTDLEGTDLSSTYLRGADLRGANLRNANLRNANLRNANLRSTDLRNANLIGIKTNIYTIGYNLACPEKGSFIGYKKAGKYIIELLILKDAKRSSATTMKCRCNKAKVLHIEDIKTGEKIETVNSNYNPNFVYKVGEIVTVEDFDDDRWNECAPGIHFFMNKENAINY